VPLVTVEAEVSFKEFLISQIWLHVIYNIRGNKKENPFYFWLPNENYHTKSGRVEIFFFQSLANLGHVFPCEIINFSGQNLANCRQRQKKTPCHCRRSYT
jgi:hypothetical protein